MLENLLAETPDDAELHYALAMEEVAAGDHAGAVKRFRDLLARSPDRPHVPAFLMAAQSLVKLGQTAEAIACLREGVAAARKQNNEHAAGEMQGLLDSLE
jgi:predicted Zn-dependent protease